MEFASAAEGRPWLGDVLFYLTCRVEKIVALVAEEVVWPALADGGVARTRITDFVAGQVPSWSKNSVKDVAVLATMMALPKEGPSAGVTIVTGIVSALTGRPVRNDLAMTGEVTIMGKVLGVGGILPKLQAAIDAGCREVVVPQENERDVAMIPEYLRGKIQIRYVATAEEAIATALLPAK